MNAYELHDIPFNGLAEECCHGRKGVGDVCTPKRSRGFRNTMLLADPSVMRTHCVL